MDVVPPKPRPPVRSGWHLIFDNVNKFIKAIANKIHLKQHRFVLALIIMVAIAIAGSWIYHNSHTSPIPKNIQQQVNFPVYYPSQLPAGFSLNKKSISVSRNVVVYEIRYGDKEIISVSVQAKPQDFNFDSLSGNQEFTTPYGKAYIVTPGTRTTGSLVASNAWVILNTTQGIGTDQMKSILDNLQPTR